MKCPFQSENNISSYQNPVMSFVRKDNLENICADSEAAPHKSAIF